MPATQPKPAPLTLAPAHPTLRIYNTLTKRKEPFATVEAGKVGIYLCGPTVYDKAHIGHMVGPVIFLLSRALGLALPDDSSEDLEAALTRRLGTWSGVVLLDNFESVLEPAAGGASVLKSKTTAETIST